MKTCTKCNVEQPLDNFSKDSKGKFGVKSRCKVCIKEYDTEYNKFSCLSWLDIDLTY